MNDLSAILTYRGAEDPARRANLETVLGWLAREGIAQIVVVEQDVAPSLFDLPAFAGLATLFAYNPGPFNKGWGLNVGARVAGGTLLAFADADLICPGLAEAIALARGAPVVRAFSRVIDLDAAQSDQARGDHGWIARHAPAPAADRRSAGEHPPSCGGLVLFQRPLFELLGCWDERFLGWGAEDDAMSAKVRRAGLAVAAPARAAFHLWHRRALPDPDDAGYRANLALLRQIEDMPEDALRRLCEISLQLAGHGEMHRPPAPFP